MKGFMFVSVEFTEDPNVCGRTYWYLCEFNSVDIGTMLMAPIGSHNKLQPCVVRRVMFAEDAYAPFPVSAIKRIAGIITEAP